MRRLIASSLLISVILASPAFPGFSNIPTGSGGGAAGSSGNTGKTGASGATGATGSAGAAGASGLTGASGASGASGSSGASGLTGASGAAGSSGSTGATGATGAITALTDSHILVGNGSNVPTDVAMSGKVTISNTGVTSINSFAATLASTITSDTTTAEVLKLKSSTGNVYPILTITSSANTDMFYFWHNGVFEILSGTTTIQGIMQAAGGTAGTPGFRYSGDLDTGLYHPSNDVVGLATNGLSRLEASSSGVAMGLPVGLKSYATSGLPAASTAGQIAFVSDSVPPTVQMADGTSWQSLDQNITCDSGTIADAQVKTLNSSPVTLTCTAALGSGYAWQVKQGVAYEDYNGTAYATNTTLLIVPCSSTGITLCTFGTMLTVTADTQRGCGPTTTVNAMQDNGSLCAFVSTGDPTGGTAGTTLRVRAYVRKVAYPVF